jgi:hypothetical protein
MTIVTIVMVIGSNLNGGRALAAEFEIDEIITAIKNEIQTANITDLGTPRFTIETVDVALTVVSTETEKGGLAVKIIGFNNDVDDHRSGSLSHHKLSYSFRPVAASGISPDISMGLVEPITRVKASFRKACNTLPGLQMDGFTFKLEFALVQTMDGAIHFRILELEDMKARNISTHHVTLHVKIAN